MNKAMNNWSQQELINWVNTLSSISQNNKQKIIDGINDFSASGQDVFDVDKDDLAENFEITRMLAGKLFQAIQEKRGQQFKYNQPGYTSSPEGGVDFNVNLTGQKGAFCTIGKLKSSYTVKYLKERYLDYYGHDFKNKDKFDKLTIRRMNTVLQDDKTLSYYHIFDDTITLTVTFRVNGGLAQQLYHEHKEDENRIRRLKHKKYKQIKLSNDPDCIMGYTNKDGIKRAEMPCGCSFSAFTMYNFMKAAFDQDNNFRAFTMECPVLPNQCKGTKEKRQWDWSLVFIVSDLSPYEKAKYSKIINNRIAGIKCCPHCNANCERPKNLRIYRVQCKVCNKPDWCWECRKIWKGAKTTSTVCGNGNCIADRLNAILKNSKIIDATTNENCSWASGLSVPDIRHCPKCFTIIEYVKNCKHVKCTGCPYEFCFMCLSRWKGHSSSSCKVATIQQII